jgi:G3E family GTPase
MERVPIALITGFLGSGKSTLVNRLLKVNPDTKFAVILNEFGDISLESEFIEIKDEEVVELSNGCMCCVARSDIISAVDKLLQNAPDTEYIIAEASGLSDPLPVAQTFMSTDLDGKIQLDSLLAVVDALNFERGFEEFEVATKQIRFADLVVISKTELVEEEKLEKIKEIIDTINPHTRILYSSSDQDIKLAIDVHNNSTDGYFYDGSVSVGRTTQEEEIKHDCCHSCHNKSCHCKHTHTESGHHNHSSDGITEVIYRSEQPIDITKLDSLFANLPESTVRAKGYIYTDDERVGETHKFLLQYVGSRVQLEPKAWSPDEKKQSAILFLGKNIDAGWMEEQLKLCETGVDVPR